MHTQPRLPQRRSQANESRNEKSTWPSGVSSRELLQLWTRRSHTSQPNWSRMFTQMNAHAIQYALISRNRIDPGMNVTYSLKLNDNPKPFMWSELWILLLIFFEIIFHLFFLHSSYLPLSRRRNVHKRHRKHPNAQIIAWKNIWYWLPLTLTTNVEKKLALHE